MLSRVTRLFATRRAVPFARMMSMRVEKDTMGEVEVPSDKYWGAQTPALDH